MHIYYIHIYIYIYNTVTDTFYTQIKTALALIIFILSQLLVSIIITYQYQTKAVMFIKLARQELRLHGFLSGYCHNVYL